MFFVFVCLWVGTGVMVSLALGICRNWDGLKYIFEHVACVTIGK